MPKLIVTITTLLLVAHSGYASADATQHQQSPVCAKATGKNAADAVNRCSNFVEGFLYGALITDAAIIANLANNQGSSFSQRAFNTRVGNTTQRLPPTYYAKFCLPEQQINAALVQDISKVLMAEFDAQVSPAQQLYALLQRDYPCPTLE